MRAIKCAPSSDASHDVSPEAVDNDWASPGHVHAPGAAAKNEIARLRTLGIDRMIMLSGDNQ